MVPNEASVLSLFVVLRKTRYDKSKPFQLWDTLQQVIFIESGAPQNWPRKLELLAVSAIAVYEHRVLPTFRISQKTWDPVAMWKGCWKVVVNDTLVDDKFFQARSLLSELTTADSWVVGTWLCRRDWLAVRLTAPCERDLSPPLLVLHKETRPNSTAELLRQPCSPVKVQLFVSVCELYLRWSVLRQPCLKCMHAEFFHFLK